jgi:hypothetical protein
MDIPNFYTVSLATTAVLVIIGIIGAALSKFVRLTIVGGGRDA